MSTKKRKSSPPPGLSAAEVVLLDTQLPEIGGAVREKPVKPDGNGWRIGKSSKISRSGSWYDFKLSKGGFGAVAYVAHYCSCTLEEAVAWAREWLATHTARGPCTGYDDEDSREDEASETTRRRAYLENLYDARQPIANTPAAVYLKSRGLDPAKLRPEIVERMGYLPCHRGEEGALVYPYCDEAETLQGLHFVYITADGGKSPHEPPRQMRRGPPNWRTAGLALLRLDFGTGPEMVVTEGFEDALAVSLLGYERVVAVGAVSAYGLCRLPLKVETIILAHDGDDPSGKPEPVQAYHRGVVRYLGQGLAVRMTAPPSGRDPNDVLLNDGQAALKQLLTEARCCLGRFDQAAFLDEVYKLGDFAYDRARKTALGLLGLRLLDTLDKDRASTRRRWAEAGDGAVPPPPDDQQPWAEPVTDIGPVLDTALKEISRFVFAPKRRLAAAVLWAAQVHLLPRDDLGIDVAPRLAIRSQVKGSGKSTLLECIDNLTPNPIIAGSITASSLFRVIDGMHPTLLIDEADNVVNKNGNPDLLAILNSGHRRAGAYVIRSVPTDNGGWLSTNSKPSLASLWRGSKFSPRRCKTAALRSRSTRRPKERSGSTSSTDKVRRSSIAAARSRVGLPTFRSFPPLPCRQNSSTGSAITGATCSSLRRQPVASGRTS